MKSQTRGSVWKSEARYEKLKAPATLDLKPRRAQKTQREKLVEKVSDLT